MQKFIFLFLGIGSTFAFINGKDAGRLTPYAFTELRAFPKMPTNEANTVTIEGANLGRYLFYDSILSFDQSMSCATCHQQARAFSDTKRFSSGVHGVTMKRNTPGLFNLAWLPRLFWDGRANSIEGQAFQPVSAHDEMGLNWKEASRRLHKQKFYREKFKEVFGTTKIDSVLITKAIAQFERTLISANSKFDKVLQGGKYLSKMEYKGFELMNDQTKGDCLHCHTTDANAVGTTGQMSNNGLDVAINSDQFSDKGFGAITNNESDYGKFKIPSLRNLLFTAPYMHDGRFETLEEVIEFYNNGLRASYTIDSKMQFVHKGGMKLKDYEKECIILFLKTLTDSTFTQNPEFSNPFNI
ncbi:MAG: cytochrome c peroxidase [Salibacteraceae bacterium]